MQMRGRVLPVRCAWARCGRGEPRPYRVYIGTRDAPVQRARQQLGFEKLARSHTQGNVFQATVCRGGIDSLVLVL
jgi:hypothetical protein